MATDVEQREDAMEHVYRLLDRSRGTWRVMDMLAGLLKTFAVCTFRAGCGSSTASAPWPCLSRWSRGSSSIRSCGP